jgi:anti-sigma B factor antagonist
LGASIAESLKPWRPNPDRGEMEPDSYESECRLDGADDARFQVFEIEGGDTAVLTLNDSYINYATSDVLKPRLKQAIALLVAAGRRTFVLDMVNVGVMDSCGLAVIISVKKYIDSNGGSLAISGLSSVIQRLFSVTGLDRAFDIYPSFEEAIQAA